MWYFCGRSQHVASGESTDRIDLEGGAVRDPDGQVREHGERLVRADALEREVVRDLVDREEQVVVRRPAEHVREREQAPPAHPTRRVRGRELERDDARDDVLCARLATHQLGHLRVRGEDRAPPRAVRLLRVQPQEVIRVLRWLDMLVVVHVRTHPARGAALGQRLGTAIQ